MDVKTFKFLLSWLIITFVTSLISLDWYYFWHLPADRESNALTQITVYKGDSGNDVTKSLINTELFSRPLYIKIYFSYLSLFSYCKYGDYIINPQLSPTQIISQITAGKVKLHKFTIIPGMSWEDLYLKIKETDFLEQTINSVKDINIFCLKNHIPSIEGWLAPDSYFIARGTKDLALLSIALKQQRKILKELSSDGQCSLDRFDTVTLASIIEKESSLINEFALISSTYQNRLQQGMKLQSDPTVRYSQAYMKNTNLKYKDLKQDHPHNTYLHYGLPPSAIAYPSKSAIIAACRPAQSDFLYFVAEPSKKKHIFTKTYKEHLNVQSKS